MSLENAKTPCTGFSVLYRKDEDSNSTVHEAVIMSDDVNIVLDASTMNQLVYDWENPNDEDDLVEPITRYVTRDKPDGVQKIVIHHTWGTFDLPEDVLERLGLDPSDWSLITGIKRDDPNLVKVIEELKPSNLRVVEIPVGVEWEIQEYDGSEWVAEKHRTWR